jgi:hypothetical protein
MEGVKKIGPTTYEVRKTDFLPQADLNILILKRLKGARHTSPLPACVLAGDRCR